MNGRRTFRHPEDLRRHGLEGDLGGKRVAIQGFGNVAYHVARFLAEEDGCRIVAVGDVHGGAHRPKGLDVEALANHRDKTGTLLGLKGATDLNEARDVLEVDCDILVPAALENQITLRTRRGSRPG